MFLSVAIFGHQTLTIIIIIIIIVCSCFLYPPKFPHKFLFPKISPNQNFNQLICGFRSRVRVPRDEVADGNLSTYGRWRLHHPRSFTKIIPTPGEVTVVVVARWTRPGWEPKVKPQNDREEGFLGNFCFKGGGVAILKRTVNLDVFSFRTQGLYKYVQLT